MNEKRLPKFLTMKQFREQVINWTDDTIRDRIKNAGLPAMQEDNGRWLFPTADVLDWFKRKTVKSA